MRTIDTENEKTFRHSFDVYLGIDAERYEVAELYCDDALSGYEEQSRVLQRGTKIPLMDLSGGGFRADGEHRPIGERISDSSKYGLIASTIGTSMTLLPSVGTGVIHSEADVDVTVLYSDNDNNLYKYTTTVTLSSSTLGRQITVPAIEGKRMYVERVLFGNAWEWRNDTIISANLDLRGLETVPTSPTLQASEIDFQVINEEDVKLQELGVDTPIWYRSGYINDMCDDRLFYLSDAISVSKGTVSARGMDAVGTFLDDIKMNAYGGLPRFNELGIQCVLCGIFEQSMDGLDVKTVGINPIPPNNEATNFVVFDSSLRDAIARTMMFQSYGTTTGQYLKFVDAGTPTFTLQTVGENVKTINNASLFESEMSRADGIVYGQEYLATKSTTTSTIASESVVAAEIRTYSFSDYYDGVTVSNATIIESTPSYVTYKATETGTCTISGYLIKVTTGSSFSTARRGNRLNKTIEIDEIYGNVLRRFTAMYDSIYLSLNTNNKLYSFTWRGDPRLNPRDYISVNGQEMTIESINLSHTGGGLTSTIKARKGFL